jgi:hypothetical protein
MINVARVGVMDHKLHITAPVEKSRNLINRAAPTDRQSTRTAKIAALLVSVSFVNITPLPFSRRFVGEVCGRGVSPRPRYLGY